MFALLLLAVLSNTASSRCGYADLTATIDAKGFPFVVGDFILSTDKCQALSANISLKAFNQKENVDGAIKFSCDPTDNTRLIVNEYNNALCNGYAISSAIISRNEKVNLFNKYLYFTLNEFVCSETDCGIDITFSDDCRGIYSSKYSNLAIPTNSCQTFANDFGHETASFALLSTLPYEILPTGAVNGLFSTALQFECCQHDNSLLIYDYTATNCESNTQYNTLRLSNEYNGQCFVLGDDQIPFDASTSKANTNDININHNVYALKYTWTCNTYVDCTGIDFMDDTQLPNLCPDKCLESGYTFPPTFSPTATPTFHPVVNDNMGPVTVAPRNVQGNGHTLGGAFGVVLIGVIIFVLFVAVGVIGLCVYNKRKMARVVEESGKQNQIKKTDSRYEPMIANNNNNNNVDMVTVLNNNINTNENVNENDIPPGQYVLPSKVTTDGGNTHDDANLLTNT